MLLFEWRSKKYEEKEKNKVIIIIALIVSVIGMSIGFAVFSDALAISSSATVMPNEDDFKVTIYGLNSSFDFSFVSDAQGKYVLQTNTNLSDMSLYSDNKALGLLIMKVLL